MKFIKKITKKLCPLLLFPALLNAAETDYVLKGKVMDTSGNWLNDARVGLKRETEKTYTDPNGNFELKVSVHNSRIKKDGKLDDKLEIDKEGHIGQSLKIESVDFFNSKEPLVIKLEPNPISGDNVGFSTRMSLLNAVEFYLNDLYKAGNYNSRSFDISTDTFAKVIADRKITPPEEKSTQAHFNVYIPESVKKVKAAFYLSLHGIGTTDNPVLRAFAEEEQIALIGFNGDPVQRGILPVSLLDEQLKKLAEMSNHPELTEVPFFTFGHSNGTGFAGCLPSQRPERVIAWISYHAGVCSYLQFPNVEKVPALVMCGAIDGWFLKHRQDKVVTTLREKRNAPICLMLEGSVGHGPVNQTTTWKFVVDYCKAAMKIRLKDDGTLRDVDISKGWLGSNYDLEEGGQQLLEIAPYNDYKGNKSTANWFPTKDFAETWQTYGNTKPSK